MIFTDYLDSIIGTEDEARLLEQIDTFKDEIAHGVKIPIVGKTVASILALAELGSIAEFKAQTNYAHLEGWRCKINLDNGSFSLYPSKECIAQQAIGLAIIAAIVVLLVIRWKRKRKK